MAWAERLPSGRWRAVYRDAAGVRRSAGTHTHKPRALRAAAAAEEKARRRMAADPDAHRRPWGEWADEWWPARGVEPSTAKVDGYRRGKYLDPQWGSVPIGSIRRQDVKAWAARLRREGVGPASVQRIVRLLSASLEAAVDEEIIDSNPAARLKLAGGEQAVDRYLTREEYAAVRAQMPTLVDQLLVDVLANTGLRWGELAGLHRGRVDLARGQLVVAETYQETGRRMKPYPKGRRSRVVPLPQWLVDALAEHLEAYPDPGGCGVEHVTGSCRSGLVFTTESGTPLRNSNWSPGWRRAVEESGIGHCRIHDLRHTYASWLLQAGVPIAEVGRLLGHVSPVTTQRYAHLSGETSPLMLAALLEPAQD